MDRMVALRGPRDSLVPALRMCLEVEMGVGGSSMTQLTLMLITVMNMVVWGLRILCLEVAGGVGERGQGQGRGGRGGGGGGFGRGGMGGAHCLEVQRVQGKFVFKKNSSGFLCVLGVSEKVEASEKKNWDTV